MKEHFGGDSNGIISLNEELAKYSKKYPYEVLVKRIVPEGVDVVNKEVQILIIDELPDEDYLCLMNLDKLLLLL